MPKSKERKKPFFSIKNCLQILKKIIMTSNDSKVNHVAIFTKLGPILIQSKIIYLYLLNYIKYIKYIFYYGEGT